MAFAVKDLSLILVLGKTSVVHAVIQIHLLLSMEPLNALLATLLLIFSPPMEHHPARMQNVGSLAL